MEVFYKEHTKHYVAVDCIVFGFENKQLKLLIGKRKMDPGRNEWSLYGGFVKQNECLDDAVNRVLYDLTGIKDIYMKQVGAYGNIDRDPGERVISVAYCALINVNDYNDQMRKEYELEWVSIDELPVLYSDHRIMIEDALKMLRKQISSELFCFNLLPNLFTLTQLQSVYEAILNKELDKRNFRKKVKTMNLVEKTELKDKISSKRGAYLYRFNKKIFAENCTFTL